MRRVLDRIAVSSASPMKMQLRFNFAHVEKQMKRTFSVRSLLLLVSFAVLMERPPLTARPEHNASASQGAHSAQEIWADLQEGNRRFLEGKTRPRDLRSLRASLEKAQHPYVVVLACSDSRVAPELLFDQSLGDLFVVRSAGNIADAIGVGSIEYAVEHLGSSVLVVLGHTKCGAVTAACSRGKMPTPNLQTIVDKIGPAVSRAEKSEKADEFIESAIKENVHQSAKDVLAHSDVLRHFMNEGKLTVLEAEYQLDTGAVVRLNSGAKN